MPWIHWSLTITALLVATVTILPWFKHPAWWVRIWDFPRLQLALICLVGLGLTLAYGPTGWWRATLLITFGAAVLYQAWWILPYTPLWRKEALDAETRREHGQRYPRLKVMACNVLTPNRESHKLIDLVLNERPDLLVLLETDAWWQAQMSPIEPLFPHRVFVPQDNLYGMHLYSRIPLRNTEISFLVDPEIPSIHTSAHLTQDVIVRMHFLHPTPPSPTENDESTERDVELLMVAKSLKDEEAPAIVAGDLNDVGWSPTTRMFRKLSGMLDPRVGRGMFSSFHAKHWFARWPLDHFFHSDHFQVVRIARLPAMGSDHFPVFLELEYHPANAALQEGLQADAEDVQEANQKLAEEGANADDVPEPTAKG